MRQSESRLVESRDQWELGEPPVLIASEEEAAQIPGISIYRNEEGWLMDEAEQESRKTGIYRPNKHEDESIEGILDDISRLQSQPPEAA